MTNWTPPRPRSFNDRKNAVQNRSDSVSPMSVEPEDFTAPISCDPDGHDDRLGHDPAIDPGLAIRRVKEHVRKVHCVKIAASERADFGIQVSTDP